MEIKTEIREIIEQAIKGNYTMNEASEHIFALFDVMGQSGQLCPKCKGGYMFASDYSYIQCSECRYTIGYNCP